MELPSIEELLSLTRAVSGVVELSNVTGDFPLQLAFLTCEELDLRNMEVDQATFNTELPGCCGQQTTGASLAQEKSPASLQLFH